jgi:hypothetical protein
MPEVGAPGAGKAGLRAVEVDKLDLEGESVLIGRVVLCLTGESWRRGLGLAVEGYMDHEGRRG